MRVLVTGSSGHLGRVLVARLLAEPGVEAVTGVDLAPPPEAPAVGGRFHFLRADVAALDDRLSGHQALVHLAWRVVAPAPGTRLDDVAASGRLLAAAARRGVSQVLFVSSAAVYGPPAGARGALDEHTPPAPLPGFAYARAKLATEELLHAHHRAGDFRATVLRPGLILGPGAQPLLARLLAAPFRPAGRAGRARVAWVHEADVAEALWRLLAVRQAGVFNIAAPQQPPLARLQQALGGGRWPLPRSLVRAGCRWHWRRAGAAEPAAWAAALGRELVLDCSAMQQALDWAPGRGLAQLRA